MTNTTIKVRRTVDGYSAHSPQVQALNARTHTFGYGATPQDAILDYMFHNPSHFNLRTVVYDMADVLTQSYVNNNSISNTKLL